MARSGPGAGSFSFYFLSFLLPYRGSGGIRGHDRVANQRLTNNGATNAGPRLGSAGPAWRPDCSPLIGALCALGSSSLHSLTQLHSLYYVR